MLVIKLRGWKPLVGFKLVFIGVFKQIISWFVNHIGSATIRFFEHSS